MLNNINNFYVIIFIIGIALYLYNRENFSWWGPINLPTNPGLNLPAYPVLNQPPDRFVNPVLNLPAYPVLNQPINPFLNQPRNLPTNQLLNQFINPPLNNAESQAECINRIIKEPNQWDFESNNKCESKTKKRIELLCKGNYLPNVRYSSPPVIKRVICPRAGSSIVDKYNKQKRGGIADESTYYINNNMNSSALLY